MDKLYVLNRGIDYEGETTISLHRTLDGAKKAANLNHPDEWYDFSNSFDSYLCNNVQGGYYAIRLMEVQD